MNALELGPCATYDSVEALVASPEIDAVWICGPNDTRLDAHARDPPGRHGGRGTLRGVACEKPLGRNLAEAREMLRLAEDAGLNHGYLENQVFAAAVQRGKEIIWRRGVPSAGRPYLARAAEEHSGPHMPWFWQGERQGGGVLSDMMCHSVEVGALPADRARAGARQPDADERERDRRDPEVDPPGVCRATARGRWARMSITARRPAEDFARATLTFRGRGGPAG